MSCQTVALVSDVLGMPSNSELWSPPWSQVTAHDNEEGATVYLIKFDPAVLEREKRQA